MRPKRRLLLSTAFLLASFLAFLGKKIFDYGAAPTREKESDFVFPREPDQRQTNIVAPPPEQTINLSNYRGFINDASHLNRTPIYGVVKVHSEQDIAAALSFARDHRLKVTCAGERHSMGGQAFVRDGLVLDLRNFNQITLDKQHKRMKVQSGARWWQVQQLLDKEGLSVSAMQSINLFSIGGTLSLNAHGIDPSPGPIASSVRSLRVMLSSGDVVNASPKENADLFRHVLGGYGLFGVILDADLDVVENEMYERQSHYIDYKAFPEYYRANIDTNHDIGLAFARLSVAPKSFLRETAIHTYRKTKFDGPLPALKPARQNVAERLVINFSKTGGLGRAIRWSLEKHFEPYLHNCVSRNQALNQKEPCLVSRNGEMYDDMAYLKNRLPDTDILQEYFVPFDKFPEFVDALRAIVQQNQANLLNVTIRTVHQDKITALPYAKQDMFALVLYFNVKFNEQENESLRKTTSELIDAALAAEGTFYLPYQLFYSPAQLQKSYPEIDASFAAKAKYDPAGLFTNKFFEKYGR